MQDSPFTSIKDLLDKRKPTQVTTSIAYEYQDYGITLAHELGDVKRKSLYIKLARDKDRQLLERARAFVKDANAKSPAGLFMWKLGQLEEKNNQ